MEENYILLVDQLKNEYLDTFKKIELYANIHYIDSQSQNDMLMDLIDLFLTAQQKQTPIEKITGKNLEKFCQSFFAEYQGKKRFLTLFQVFYHLAWGMLGMELFFLSFNDGALLQPSNISGYFTGIAGGMIASILLHILLRPFLFRFKKLTSGIWACLNIALSLILSFGLLLVLDDYNLEVPVWCTFATCGTYIVIYIIVRAVFRYRDHGTIWKKREFCFLRSIQKGISDINKQVPFELEKKLLKKNKKRAKRGKDLITDEKFLNSIERDIKTSKYVEPIVIVFLLIYLLSLIIRVMMEDGFLEGLIFTLVLSIAEIPAVFIFWASFIGYKQKKEIVSICQKRNITFSEYVEELRNTQLKDMEEFDKIQAKNMEKIKEDE